jgi:predicted nucleotidyltransferase
MSTARQTFFKQIKKAVFDTDPEAEVILFGSRARGDFRPDSDWDILVLLNKKQIAFAEKRSIRKQLFKVELETEQPISAFVFSSFDWYSAQKDTPLFESVEIEGIRL